MDVIVLEVFVSLLLALGSLLLFGHSARQRDYEHADRLALLPVEPDGGVDEPSLPTTPRPEAKIR